MTEARVLAPGEEALREVVRAWAEGEDCLWLGPVEGHRAALLAQLVQASPADARPVLAVCPTEPAAERLATDLAFFLGSDRVLLFPSLELYPHEPLPPSDDVARARVGVLTRLVLGWQGVVVAAAGALTWRLLPPAVFRAALRRLAPGERVDPVELSGHLVRVGYERVERVEQPGTFAIRGGLVDLFPPDRLRPIRVELFDVEVESVREFDPASQRSTEAVPECFLPPAREFFLPPGADSYLPRLVAEAHAFATRLEKLGHRPAALRLREEFARHQALLEGHVSFRGIDQYRSAFLAEPALLLDYLPKGSLFLDEPLRIEEVLTARERETGETLAALLEGGALLPCAKGVYAFLPALEQAWRHRRKLYRSLIARRLPGGKSAVTVSIPSRQPESARGDWRYLVRELRRFLGESYRITIVMGTAERAQRLVAELEGEGIPARLAGAAPAGAFAAPPPFGGLGAPGSVEIRLGRLSAGFDSPGERWLVLTDLEVLGKVKKPRRPLAAQPDAERIRSWTELTPGDYVVHSAHGIGRYTGMETLEIHGVHKDYLVVQYAGGDRLYVPTDQVNLLQKYIGGDGTAPRLYRLGGSEWARVKRRVKESVKELAEELLGLYAERQAAKGFAFSPDTIWQREFEDAFPFAETPDQLRAIEEVKRDMEAPRPMDRLLCGDVGFGKTEVAVRAAFKAVMDGKQVAVLVPTTILAQQHHRTFTERFEGYPVRVRVLSRFQTPAEQGEIIEELASGGADIVIGTHRLLSKDVRFKDLGLLIIDEEQRFGVMQKERLKQLRKNVDVLTMSATPIPRTLYMSLVGVRDMSIIETPPEDRYPVRTYVIEFNEAVVREAILRELAREGQVYVVVNRVKKIDRVAQELRKLVPEARIAVAHGQMEESRLERVMLDFLEGEYDILLCTTIIETGMDLPNVNTLVVYDADQLGLAQLYQLRGRVGRSNRIAYAYFTYPQQKVLSEDAERRLAAIKEFTALGSGFKIAMRDLEIRGAGNLLGPEQHGFIASVGFEMYRQLLDESIRELRGEQVSTSLPEPTIDLDVDAYLPDTYIPDSNEKVALYRRLLAMRSEEELAALREELVDRFGLPPPPVDQLLEVARVKLLAKQLGVASIGREREGVTVRFLPGLVLPGRSLQELAARHRGRLVVWTGSPFQLRIRDRGLEPAGLLRLLGEILAETARSWPSAAGE